MWKIVGLILFAHVMCAQVYTKIEVQSTLNFTIRNSGIEVDGNFTGLTGTVQFDMNALSSSYVKVEVPANTINTGIKARDNHLRKEEYFNVAQFPFLKFTSNEIKKNGNGYKVRGMFTIKGKTKEMEITCKASQVNGKLELEADFAINRLDFGVGSSSWILSDIANVHVKLILTP